MPLIHSHRPPERDASPAADQGGELLDLGAIAFTRALKVAGVESFFFELFDATHRAIEYRYPMGLRYLAERLG